MFARRLCLGSPGGEMSGEALLATPARPLYEPSHRPQKRSARSRSLFAQENMVTDDQQAAPVHSGPPFFGFRAYRPAAVTACPTPSGHKVRRIAADIRNGSKNETARAVGAAAWGAGVPAMDGRWSVLPDDEGPEAYPQNRRSFSTMIARSRTDSVASVPNVAR
jgi:hypothetical protein